MSLNTKLVFISSAAVGGEFGSPNKYFQMSYSWYCGNVQLLVAAFGGVFWWVFYFF